MHQAELFYLYICYIYGILLFREGDIVLSWMPGELSLQNEYHGNGRRFLSHLPDLLQHSQVQCRTWRQTTFGWVNAAVNWVMMVSTHFTFSLFWYRNVSLHTQTRMLQLLWTLISTKWTKRLLLQVAAAATTGATTSLALFPGRMAQRPVLCPWDSSSLLLCWLSWGFEEMLVLNQLLIYINCTMLYMYIIKM